MKVVDFITAIKNRTEISEQNPNEISNKKGSKIGKRFNVVRGRVRGRDSTRGKSFIKKLGNKRNCKTGRKSR